MGRRSELTGGTPPPAVQTQASARTPQASLPHSRRDTARRWAVRAMLPTALALWLVSLRDVDLRRMRDLGLLQVLPVSFWIALALLTLSFCMALYDRRTKNVWLAAHVLGLIAVLHATPTLLYATLRYAWAWKHVAVVDAVLRHDGVPETTGRFAVYDAWPGFFELNALFLRATGMDSVLGYAAWAPPVSNALLVLPLLLLYRSVVRDRRLVWGAVWIYFSCAWIGQDYFAPQTFAFLLFVTVIALVLRQLPSSVFPPSARPRWGAWRRGPLLAVLIMEIAIACSHPLTPLMLISALLALSIPRRNRRVTLPVLAGAVAATAAWDATVARPYLEIHLNSLMESLLNPSSNVASGGLAALGTAAPGQVLLAWIDRGLTAGVVLLAVMALWRRPSTRRTGMPLLLIAPLAVLVANNYGGEMIFRVYLFALPAAAFLISALLFERDTRRLRAPLVVYPLLLCMLGGLAFGYYGKESVNSFTREEVAAARYVTDHAPRGARILTLTTDVAGIDMSYDRHSRVSLAYQHIRDRKHLVGDPLATVEAFVAEATAKRPAYIVLTRAQHALTYLTGVLPADTQSRVEKVLSESPEFTVVYHNRDAVVFRYAPPEAGGR
ncbi:glycosyltransferase [Streptomyces cavernae]|uniref:glycosyltransferase n=1 Tax=Streptomyces cavernae TaxID=2259034 RepID=UPI000FEBD627|nr:glycosyltransferase [Streptomyces cavernae]